MKKGILVVLVVVLGLMGNALAHEAKEEKNTIVANGEAKIWVDPDRARVFLGIETMRETISLARDQNAGKIKNVMQALKALRIKGMLIKAPSYNVSLVKEQEHYAKKTGRLPKILGYKVKQDFTVLLESKDARILSKDAARVIDTALDNGVNIITNVAFFKEDESKDKRNALALAVQDAISNAKTIAKTAGVSIKEYSQIHSSYLQPYGDYTTRQMTFTGGEGGPGAPTTLVAGKKAVTCRVTLSCSVK
jgi:uncharacterized protein YggE